MDESGKKAPGPTEPGFCVGTTLDPAIDIGYSVVDFREGVGGSEELRRSLVDGSVVSSPR